MKKKLLIYCSIKIPLQNNIAQKLLSGMFVSTTVFHKLNNYYLFINKIVWLFIAKERDFVDLSPLSFRFQIKNNKAFQ